jgi:ABC-type multidrug transport system fused ATPase/permease subunit
MSAADRVARAVRLVAVLTRRHRRPFFIAVAGAGVFAVCTVLSSVAIRRVVDNVLVPRFEEGSVGAATVMASLGLVIGIGLLRAAGVVVRRSFAGIAEWRAAQSLAGDLLKRMAEQPISWFARRSTGDLVARLSTDTEAAVSVLAPLPFASSVVVMLFVAAVLMLLTDLVMGLVALVLLPAVLVLNLVYQARVDRHYDEAQRQLGNLASAVHESFDGVTVVKAFGAEEWPNVCAVHVSTWFACVRRSRPHSTHCRVSGSSCFFSSARHVSMRLVSQWVKSRASSTCSP